LDALLHYICTCVLRAPALDQFGEDVHYSLDMVALDFGLAISPGFTHVRSVSMGCGVTE
jgi:hypothetical protein